MRVAFAQDLAQECNILIETLSIMLDNERSFARRSISAHLLGQIERFYARLAPGTSTRRDHKDMLMLHAQVDQHSIQAVSHNMESILQLVGSVNPLLRVTPP
jgi:hypothetical protein